MIIAGQTRGCNDGFAPYKLNSWGFSITNSGNIVTVFNKIGNHFSPNVAVTTNMRITDLAYHFVSFSFNSGKVQITLDNQKEVFDLSTIDF